MVLARGALAGDATLYDAQLAALEAQALAARPQLHAKRAQLDAARTRTLQARGWADPMLQVGVQNAGFDRWSVGAREMSWVSVMTSQTVPFPGKLEAREALAAAEVQQAQAQVSMARRETTAKVRGAWLALRFAKARLAVADELTRLLALAAQVAQARYVAGTGGEADVLRVHLELGRVEQRREVLRAAVELARQTLNRLRGEPLSTPLDAPSLEGLAFPALAQTPEAENPWLQGAEARVALDSDATVVARRAALPDVTVSAGLMVRGSLPAVWSISLGVPLPVFAGLKQSRAVDEATALVEAARANRDEARQALQLAAAQRVARHAALSAQWQRLDTTLSSAAAAAARATLEQYRVGALPLSSVLEADAVAVDTHDEALRVLAEAWQLRIDDDEGALGGGS